jgi:hypothetical protein
MPNATITSTASTFGTISGTFAADQSTITGTIAGIITGTLDGSVGVPGPTGPVGPQGPQGEPGQGVAPGGTAYQILAKVDGTDYNTEWIDDKLAQWGNIYGEITDQLDLIQKFGYYLPLAGGSLNQDAGINMFGTRPASANTGTTVYGGWGLKIQKYLDITKSTTIEYDGLNTYSPGYYTSVAPTILKVFESTNELGVTIAHDSIAIQHIDTPDQTAYFTNEYIGFEDMSGTPHSAWIEHDVITVQDVSGMTQMRATGLTFPNASVQTVAYPGSTDFLLKAGNLSGLADTSVSRTNLGLGTMSTATAADYSTTTAANALYYPLSGNPSAFLVAADIAGKAPLASPDFTGNVTITSNSASAALTITQDGAGDILRLNDVSGDTTFTFVDAAGKVNTVAATTASAGLNISHGVAPTTPVNGDIWTTTGGVFARINAGTTQLMNLGSTQTVSGSITFSNANQILGNSTAAGTINIGSGATVSASTKTLNIGTGGVSGSTTNTTIGPVLGASTTSIGGTTAASTLNLATGATLTATTKAVNIGTAGVAGSTTNITIGSTTGTSTTTLQGTTNGVTEAVDSNNTELATTAFVVGQAGSATPVVDGTAAVGTSLRYARQDHVHPTDTSRAALASPSLTGTPLSTTAAVDTNTTQIATTAYVVAQAASATPLVDGTAAVGTSLRYARADHVHPTDTSRAALNSPAFTGTPSLPTGTTAVTQTAGDNTTALATTAFVTAAVPAAATIAQSIAATSTTTYLTPSDIPAILSQGMSHRFDAINSTAVSGAGAVTASVGGFRESYTNAASTLGRAAWYAGFAPGSSTILGGLADTRVFNFSKWVYISGRSVTSSGAAGYDGDANSSIRVTFGGYSADAVGNMTQKGIGWKKLGGTGSFVTLCVHNGTTYTEVASTATMTSFQMIEWSIYSDGSGNVTLYINGAQAATTSAGPTGNTTNYYCAYREQVEQTASTATKFALHCYGGSMISQR